MRARDQILAFGGIAAICGALAVHATANAAKIETMPVSAVKEGMRGHALTVFKGTQADKFEIEIVDVIPHYLPKQDAVLFKSNDPRMMHAGIVGGMSGSPIFIDGKLLGALAYGWRFNKDPLGGITPIGNMHQVGALPFRPDVLPRPANKGGRKRKGTRAWADAMLGLDVSPLPARSRPDDRDPMDALVPVDVPLSVGGMGSVASRMLAETFGMTPVRGGSRGSAKADEKTPPHKWKFGDAVSVVLIEGDSSVAGNGTVTWVSPKGDRLLAFGHSMFDDGPVNVPMGTSRVHTIINSVERSVKLSSPLAIQGLMYQDRQAAIALRTDLRAPMVPIVTEIQGPDPDLPPRRYENRVAFGPDMTPNLVASILAEAVDEAGRDTAEVMIEVKHHISLETTKGARDIEIEEEIFFPNGLVGRILGRSRGVILVAAALDNDFEVVNIREIRQAIRMEYGSPLETIASLRVAQEQVRAGDLIDLEVTLRDFKGDEHVETYPIRVPDDAGNEEIQIEIASGDMSRPYRPIPSDIDDLLTTIQVAYPSRSVVVSIYREAEGLSTRGALMPELPDSVLETLVDRGGTRDAVKLKQLSRRVIPTKKIVEGIQFLRVDVLPRKSF
jgi:hypothetical protein